MSNVNKSHKLKSDALLYLPFAFQNHKQADDFQQTSDYHMDGLVPGHSFTKLTKTFGSKQPSITDSTASNVLGPITSHRSLNNMLNKTSDKL